MVSRERNPETDARGLLGELLKLARLEAGFRSQAQLSEILQTDRTNITRTETGDRLINGTLMGEWLTQCGVSGLARAAIEGLWRLSKAWGEPAKARTAPWFETEAAAHTLRYWAPQVIPGIVQTKAYARALFGTMGHDEAKIRQDVEDRIARQSILARPEPPTVIIVLDEYVLHRPIGSPEIMREQCERLLQLSESIVIQVVPRDVGAHPGLGATINLAATGTGPELLGSDGLVEDTLTNNPVLVRKASATFDSVRAEALPRSASRRVISEAIEIHGTGR
jgi:hypothetical protein